MKVDDVEAAFRRQITVPVGQLTLREGVRVMLAFYASRRVDGTSFDEDGDMLLFQWGTYDFDPPPTFQANVTRQLIVSGEDEPYQLSLTFHFAPKVGRGNGSKWCRLPADVPQFAKFIDGSEPMSAVGDAAPQRVMLAFHQC